MREYSGIVHLMFCILSFDSKKAGPHNRSVRQRDDAKPVNILY